MWSAVGRSLEQLWSTETETCHRKVHGGVTRFSPCLSATGEDPEASLVAAPEMAAEIAARRLTMAA